MTKLDTQFIDNRLTKRLIEQDSRIEQLEGHCSKLELLLKQQERQLGIGYILMGIVIILLATCL
jgi:hypothetical protein